MLFPIGRLVATPGALHALEQQGLTAIEFVMRHARGDYGDLCEDDKQANLDAINSGARILSSYAIAPDQRIWIITDAVGEGGYRQSTCILLPSEY